VYLYAEFLSREQFNKRGIMSINIGANTASTMRSLSEQGTFRNSMYQQGEEGAVSSITK
jgi:hypothetical protein